MVEESQPNITLPVSDKNMAGPSTSVPEASVVRRPAWALRTTSAPISEGKRNRSIAARMSRKENFADIMAEQSQDRMAAQVASGGICVTLAEMQAEQERLFFSLQGGNDNGELFSQAGNSLSYIETGLCAEELRTIELAMHDSPQKLSLERTEQGLDPAQTPVSYIECCNSSSTVSSFVKENIHERRRRDLIEQTVKPMVEASLPTIHLRSGETHSIGADTASVTEGQLSQVELAEIEKAIREADGKEHAIGGVGPRSAPQSSLSDASYLLSAEEAEAIEAALKEADAKVEAESLRMALQIQQEEIRGVKERNERYRQLQQQVKGNVRTMTRAELQAEADHLHEGFDSSLLGVDGAQITPDDTDEGLDVAGFRMNSPVPSSHWNRRDRHTIVGPNNEIRTKHDVHVQGQSNAQLLALDTDDYGMRAHVGNQAFNSFKKTMKRTTKGVSTHGTGRAGTDSDATKGKAMDNHVRLIISGAINCEIIERCNGVVKQGKEAMVYHADAGRSSACDGFDVAVKVFKRIKEFRSRGEYVDGDPRYAGQPYRSMSSREQLEAWTEKEFRNLVRAHRAKVPVPTPLEYKQNVLFMRFMGNDGWPAPQIREIEMRKGSKKWEILYSQVMESMRRLYQHARLVHGDLSEYNIVIAPVFQVDYPTPAEEGDLQTVLIDFGQSVDTRHPEAMELLARDIRRVKAFFVKQGVTTMSADDATRFVVGDSLSKMDHGNETCTDSDSQTQN